jgi:hypothetical protein
MKTRTVDKGKNPLTLGIGSVERGVHSCQIQNNAKE